MKSPDRAIHARRAVNKPGWPLALAGAAALLASSCCVLPLALVMMGLSGAWLAYFRVMEPYSPLLIAGSIVALGFAWRGVFSCARTADSGGGKQCFATRRSYKSAFWIIASWTLIVLLVPVLAPLFY